MTRRAALGLLGALALAGCGGSEDGGRRPPATPAPAAQPATAVLGVQPTPEQLAFRKRLLQQLRDGTYVPCTCTAEIRARERVASGKVKPPPPDQLVSALP
jgi:hypothetical protein